MTPWWTDQQAGLLGGVAGSVIGMLGAIVGALSATYGQRGKCRGLIFGLCFFAIGIGLLSLLVGGIALFLRQPYAVYYPLLLLGFISTVVWASLLPVIRRRYQAADQRRLDAEEFRRS